MKKIIVRFPDDADANKVFMSVNNAVHQDGSFNQGVLRMCVFSDGETYVLDNQSNKSSITVYVEKMKDDNAIS